MKKILCIVFSILFSSQIFAEKISFHADKMVGSTKKNNNTTTLTGSAAIVTDNMELKADSIELSGKDFRFIKASGNISGKIKDSQMEFTCNNLNYDRQKKYVTLQNTVHLIDAKNNVVADAEIIDYSETTEIAILQINVVLVQNENTCTAAHTIYNKKEQSLIMTGNPAVQQGEDYFRAQEIVLNLETKELTLDGRVRGSVTADSKTDSSSEPKTNLSSEETPGTKQ